MIGNGLDTVFGLGEYNVRQNSLMNGDNVKYSPNGPPRVINTKKGEATVFNHREYIGDMVTGALVGGTTAFAIQTFALNPGNSALFPWLSKAASNFQEYEVQGMLVEMITEASDFANLMAVGNIMMGADYNPVAPQPANKIQLLELEYSSSVKTSSNLIMPIECAPINDSLTHLFVAIDNNYDGTDARSFDLGNIFCCSQGQPIAAAKIAEMWITYEIAFYKPRLSFGCPGGGAGAHFLIAGSTSAQPLLGAFRQVGSTPNFAINAVTNQIFLPDGAGRWMITVNLVFAGPGATVPYPLAFAGAAGNGGLQWATGAGNDLANISITNGPGAVATGLTQSFIVVTAGMNPVVTLAPGGVLPAVGIFGDVWITSVPFALLT